MRTSGCAKIDEQTAARNRRDSLYFVALGSVIFFLVGFALEAAVPISTADFRVVYFSARCILRHSDPYQQSQLAQVYHEEGGETPYDTAVVRRTETVYIYPPTAYIVTIPFALMPFGIAHLLWLACTAFAYLTACILIWLAAAEYAPLLAGCLIGLTLANSELLLILGNPAGLALSLGIIGTWCIIKERYPVLGVVCFSLGLLLKPHDIAMLWLFFALSPGIFKKRALQILSLVLAVGGLACISAYLIAPGWPVELQHNLVATSAQGDLSDPGPTSMAAHGIGMMINLQTILSLLRNQASFYNPVSYAISLLLLLPALYLTPKKSNSIEVSWFALGAYGAISMLPIYHRLYDARVLILAIPLTAVLWKKRDPMAKLAALVAAGTILLTGGIPWGIFLRLSSNLHPSTDLTKTIMVLSQVAPAPAILLVSSLIYIRAYWIYATAGDPQPLRD